MRASLAYIGLAVSAAVSAPKLAAAQDTTTAMNRDSALVLNHSFTSVIGEPIRVFLAKGVKYRATVTGSNIQLQLKTLESSKQQPLIEPLLAGQSAADETMYTITPHEDAIYVFTTIGGDPGMPVRLQVRALPGKQSKAKP